MSAFLDKHPWILPVVGIAIFLVCVPFYSDNEGYTWPPDNLAKMLKAAGGLVGIVLGLGTVLVGGIRWFSRN